MRIGLVTDVHNHAPELARALAAFRAQGVDRIVTLGDTCDAFSPPEGAGPVAALLRDGGAVGVWGNHDFSLCGQVSESIRRRYEPVVLDFMAGMKPWLEIGDCRFSHEEPWIDPHDVVQLWSVEEGPINLADHARRSFAAVPHRCIFVGHHHRWLVATSDGPVPWNGEAAITLAPPERYFVVVAGVFQGWCGLFDTSSSVLLPISCR